MSMRCRANTINTSLEVRSTTPEEEDTKAMEDMKAVKDTEAEEGVEEHLAMVEVRSSAITMDNKVTLHRTI